MNTNIEETTVDRLDPTELAAAVDMWPGWLADDVTTWINERENAGQRFANPLDAVRDALAAVTSDNT